MPSIDDALTSLHEHFGFSEFREGQREVITAILEGKNAIVVMPTSNGPGGNSSDYEIGDWIELDDQP